MNRNIFFDLDGTLLDSRQRLFLLFQKLVSDCHHTFDDYWKLKRNKIGHAEILETYYDYSAGQISEFQEIWMENIEHQDWLQYDKPFDSVTDYLLRLKKQHKLYVVTARQFESVAYGQINANGWEGIFDRIFVTGQKQEKSDLIRDSKIRLTADDWFVGDTGKDIQTGKALGLKTAAVLSGFLSKEVLLTYGPDVIADSVLELNF